MITIINYGLGNIRSIQHKLKLFGYNSVASSYKNDIKNSSILILPGVGNFKKGMENLKSLNLDDTICDEVLSNGKPIFGICLGMQLLTEYSEEGEVEGLGLIKGKTIRFSDKRKKIPHVGWNSLSMNNESPFLKDEDFRKKYYFTHSYYVTVENGIHSIAKTNYGIDFDSVISNNRNIFATQFHPEKSHKRGFQLLLDFINRSQ